MTDRSAPSFPGGADPRPEEVRAELERVADRWRALPLARAQAGMPRLRLVLDQLTDAADQPQVPDLGPATALHQLQVLVWEACRDGRPDGIPALLAGLRRDL